MSPAGHSLISAGTNPCSYTQHVVTVGITSRAPFHWKTSTLTPLHSWRVVRSKEGLCLCHNNFETHWQHNLGLLFFLFKPDVLPMPPSKKVMGSLTAVFLWCLHVLPLPVALLQLLWFPPTIQNMNTSLNGHSKLRVGVRVPQRPGDLPRVSSGRNTPWSVEVDRKWMVFYSSVL